MRLIIGFLVLFIGCRNKSDQTDLLLTDTILEKLEKDFTEDCLTLLPVYEYFVLEEAVIAGNYHIWIAETISKLQEKRSYKIDEYVLIHANPWIIDTLRSTDYYLLKERGILSKDPKAISILQPGDSLLIPDSLMAITLQKQLKNTYIDINIPEYSLRIVRMDTVLHHFKIRVGRNERRFLAMANSIVDLRTMPGEGHIVRINRNPSFINPKDNKRYKVTRRDDGVVTALPNIPWIEPQINESRYGQLIHPTTNLETLGKAVSNGCIGLSEADAWTVFFYTPLGTKIRVRYDLDITNEEGDSIQLKNIYPGMEKITKRRLAVQQKNHDANPTLPPLCQCGVE